MKILILNLARLGDIYLSWPAIRAFRRLHPDAQIDILTRRRFSGALDGLTAINNRIILPTEDVMACLLDTQVDIPESKRRLKRFTNSIRSQNYTHIFNLSFSPLSSFLMHSLAGPETVISGYTRTSDGFLAIPDDISAYFYAQVGIGRPNRYHLAEIFATQLKVDLIPEDWSQPDLGGVGFADKPADVLIHVGASEAKKQVSPQKISSILAYLVRNSQLSFGLIGAANEVEVSKSILSSVASDRISNWVGKTNLQELFYLIQNAKMLVGADSSPQHMASLTGTPCFNFSYPSVNFWETGPRAKGSAIYLVPDSEQINTQSAAQMILECSEKKYSNELITVREGSPAYLAEGDAVSEFEWHFTQAIYMSENFPILEDPKFLLGINKFSEINKLVIEQLQAVKNGVAISKLTEIFNRAEEIIHSIAILEPSLAVLVRWYQTEKVRIGPGPQSEVLTKSLEIHEMLQSVLDLYLNYEEARNPVKKEIS